MRKKIFTILLLLSGFKSLIAQNFGENLVTIKSPQSYAFEKYGNVPVNMYTGSIDLKIPITSLDAGGMNIPVFISYDSSGFIPHKKSDPAGMNWSLITGGRITRKLNGRPDEYKSQWKSIQEGGSGWGYLIDCNGFLAGVRQNPSTNIDAFNLNGGTGLWTGIFSSSTDWVFNSPRKNYYDSYETYPDVFNFNAAGISGKFIIGNDGNVLVESDDPNIKVDLSQMALYGYVGDCTPPASIITITDGNGNKYVFGGDMSKYEINYPYTRGTSVVDTMPIISSFSLSKIILNTGEEIIFNYVIDTLSSTFCVDQNLMSTNTGLNGLLISMESQYQERLTSTSNSTCPDGKNGLMCGKGVSSSGQFMTYYSILKKSVLSSIKYKDYEIKFNYKDLGYVIKHDPNYDLVNYPFRNDNEWVIDNIETFDKINLIKKTTFLYSNFGSPNPRPFLTSLMGLNGDQVYSFEYSNTNSLPSYYTMGIDHWGYWNAKDYNTKLAPTIDNTYNSVTGDYDLIDTPRDPNPYVYNVALLNKVIYPTKGYSVYEYEPQYYGKRIEKNSASLFLPALTNNSGLAGGARIKEISNYSSLGKLDSKKEYQYVTNLNGSVSSGILMNWPRYHHLYRQNNSSGYAYFDEVSSSNVQTTSLDSYNVGYSKVFEIESGKGYIEYDFSSYETHPDTFTSEVTNTKIYHNLSYLNENDMTPFYFFRNFNLEGTDKSIIRGKTLTEKIYKESNLIDPIKTVEYQYTDNVEFNPNSQIDNNKYVSINQISGFRVQGYKKYMNSSYLKKKITKEFFSGNEVKTQQEYFYDSAKHLNLTKESLLNSNNSLLLTEYKYPIDLVGIEQTPYMQQLVDVNKVNDPVITKNFNGPLKLSEKHLKYDKSNATGNLLLTKEIHVNKGTSDINVAVVNDKKIIYNLYDNKGNPLEISQENGMHTVYIWGYNQQHLIAKIDNASYSEVSSYISNLQTKSNLDNDTCLDTQACNEKTLRTDLNALRNDATYKGKWQVSTYTYNPLIGVTSITDPKGYTLYYLYDTFGRLEFVKDASGNILSENKYNYRSN